MNLEGIVSGFQKKQWLWLTLFFLVFLFIFLFFTFPGDRLISSLLFKFNQSSDVTINAENVKFSWMSGITLDKPVVNLPSGSISLKEINLKLPLFSLFLHKPSGRFFLLSDAGKITGEFILKNKLSRVKLNFSEIDLSRFSFLSGVLKGTISGILKGKMRLDFPGKWEKSNGLIVLKGRDLLVSKLPYLQLIGEKKLNFQKLSAIGKLENGKLRIESFKLGGEKFFVKLNGSVRLVTPLLSSILNLQVKLKLPPDLETKIGPLLPSAGFIKGVGGIYTKRLSGRLAFYF